MAERRNQVYKRCMRALLRVALVLVAASAFGQAPTTKQLASASGPCKLALLKKGQNPLTGFELRKGETYRNSPVVSFSISPDGSVSGVKLVRTSGVSRIDDAVVADAKNMKYKPRAGACGTVVSEMSVTIDFR